MNVSSFWTLCGASALLHLGLVWVAQAGLGGPVLTEAPGPIDVDLARSTILEDGSWAEGGGSAVSPAPAASSPRPGPRQASRLGAPQARSSRSPAPRPDRELDAPLPSPVVATAPAVAPALARFVMRSAVPSGAAQGAGALEGGAAGLSEVLPEDLVSVRARLLSAGVAVYPPRARAAEIEADVQVGIVVDRSGRVTHARPLNHPGHGLEAAALAAVRGYRFSPALHGAQPVQVRMLWTVQFRLR